MLESFHWFEPSRLAGSGLPGLFNDVGDDLAWLRAVGIRHLVTLTTSPFAFESPEIARHHFPIADMGFPTPRDAVDLCRLIRQLTDLAQPVLVHCRAGLGRTGLVIACCLVSRGTPPETAIREVRSVSPYYIQSTGQKHFVHHYANHLRSLAERAELPQPLIAPDNHREP